MFVALMLVGAHNGHKQSRLIREAATRGAVILIEPVPFLFAELSKAYSADPNIKCVNSCVAQKPGLVSFYAPTENAIGSYPYGDQLGSMNPTHAVRHEASLEKHITEIKVDAVTFDELIQKFQITELCMLFTDTEGYDALLLPQFPFGLLRPERIVFEHKHADGTFNIGKNLGSLLIMLDDVGYDIQVLDMENCMATRR